MRKYRKFITAVVGAIISIALIRYGQSNQVINAIVVLATAVGVYAVPNSGV